MKEKNYRANYGVKVIPIPKHMLLGSKPFLSLPVDKMPTKKSKKLATEFNEKVKDQIDWDYDKKS